jgi:hypothetical protein
MEPMPQLHSLVLQVRADARPGLEVHPACSKNMQAWSRSVRQ